MLQDLKDQYVIHYFSYILSVDYESHMYRLVDREILVRQQEAKITHLESKIRELEGAIDTRVSILHLHVYAHICYNME